MASSDQCITCQHYRMMLACAAFPDGIPTEIITGKHDHHNPFDGDNGIRYEPVVTPDDETEGDNNAD